MLGKYRIERRLASGGFAEVYRARDTVEDIFVALKIPRSEVLGREGLEEFRREVRLTASLDHPNILPIKSAEFIDGQLVVAMPLGVESLDSRLERRIGRQTVVEFADQVLAALAAAHSRRIIHRDLKPENIILFPQGKARLADFGLARVLLRTLEASGSGTIGYIAPEQALGKPSLRSDVFSAGLIIYRMMSGALPEWPFDSPAPGIARAKANYHPDLLAVVLKAIEVDERKRHQDAVKMLAAWRRARPRALATQTQRKRGRAEKKVDWRDLRFRQFKREYGRQLEARATCGSCKGPVSETMRHCPWCGRERRVYRAATRFPARCTRCKRGIKLDWTYCPWCYGAAIGPKSERTYTDKRYERRCRGPRCTRRELLPFMQYCPWCRTKVAHKWKIEGTSKRCGKCKWGTLPGFWQCCPWCGRKASGKRGTV